MTFQFTTQQITDITNLRNAGVDIDGTRGTLYTYIFQAITDSYGTSGEAAKSGVDLDVWLWVRGACSVNANDGEFFSNFIRNYTAEQYLLRSGEILEGSAIQNASNNIASAFALGSRPIDSGFTRA